MLPDLETRLQRGESIGVLFDANVLVDVYSQRANAVLALQALAFVAAGAVEGYVCASAFGVICHHGAGTGTGRRQRERLLAAELMRVLKVLPLTEDVLRAALGYERLSYEDAQVAAAGDLAGSDAIMTGDKDFLGRHDPACSPQELVPLLETYLGARTVRRAVRVTPDVFRVEIADPGGGWRQTRLLSGFATEEEARRVAGLRQAE